jgi:D-aspartate ligase
MIKPGAIVIEGHVQGLSNTRSLGEVGIPVIVIDKVNCIAQYSKYCTKFYKCPDFITDAFADFLIKLAIEKNLTGWSLIPSNDHAVHTLARFKNELENYYKVITPDLAAIENIYDKSKLLEMAKKSNTPFPLTQYFSSPQEKINKGLSFPVLIKGRKGLTFYKTFGRKAFSAENDKDLKKLLSEISEKIDLNETLIQELIPNDGTNKTISFTAFCIAGQIKSYWMGIKLREHPIQYGTATLAESINEEICYHQSVSLLKTLNYTGVCEVEYLKDPRNGLYKLIEINARTWLWVGLAKHCGIDYAKMIYNYLNNINSDYPSNYKTNIKWINWYTDFPMAFYSLIKGRLTVRQYMSSIGGKKVRAIYSSRDFKPTIAFFLLLINFFRRRT